MSRSLYENLDAEHREIRLLTIKASTASDIPVECSLETVSLDDEIHYLALSYVWGDAKVTANIIVNGFELPVTTNLAAALRQLRIHWAKDSFPFNELPQLIWVDAICINQGNMSERSSQVRIMGDIYQRAEKVISWIGPEADDSTIALRVIWSIFQEVVRLGDNDDRFAWLERFPNLTSNEPGQSTVWDSIGLLWARDYWSRVWVLQETVLGKDVLIMCGGADILHWICIVAVQKWAESIKVTDPRPPFITPRIWRHFAGQPIFNATPVMRTQLLRRVWHQSSFETHVKGMGLLPLQLGRELEATDPRDKVFGLLGVTDVRIMPDYSVSVRDLYIQTASEFLRLSGLTRTLNLAGRVKDNTYDLPSWVPDWSRNLRAMPVSTQRSNVEHATQESVNFHAEGSILRVTGIRLSHVQELEPDPPMPSINVSSSAATAWHLCRRYLEKHDDRMYVTGIPPLQAVLRLLVRDEDFLNDNAKLEIPSGNFFTVALAVVGALCAFGENTHIEFDERCRINLPKLGLATDENFATTFSQRFLGASSPLGPWESSEKALYSNFSAYFKVNGQLNATLDGNHVFHTASGYIGVGPDTMELGDLLYRLTDCTFPVILRQVDSHYKLIGTCLVQGLMDGEIRTNLDAESNLEQLNIH